jgi:hypothetical protein
MTTETETKINEDEKLTAEQQATAKLWADRILADERAHAHGAPKRYPNPKERLARGGQLLELPLPNGKTLGKSTGLDMLIMAEAYHIVERYYGALKAAAELLADEQRQQEAARLEATDKRAPIDRAPRRRPAVRDIK